MTPIQPLEILTVCIVLSVGVVGVTCMALMTYWDIKDWWIDRKESR
jgi:hypothetical protein